MEIFYLSHPLAPDNRYSFSENMAHVLHIMRICFEEGVAVVAPYYAMCLALDDTNPASREYGLTLDVEMAVLLGNMILVGHKLSSGMKLELNAARLDHEARIFDFVGLNDTELRQALKLINS
jgi:hypothetical protein